MKIKLSTILLASLLAFTPARLWATNYSTSLGTDTANFFQSNGTTLGNGNGFETGNGWTFAIGAFTTAPTIGNYTNWASTFRQFDLGTFLSPVDIANDSYSTSAFNIITGGATYTVQNGTSAPDFTGIASGAQLYLWVYNTQTLGTGTEWALLTNSDWVLPDLSAANPDSSIIWTFGSIGTPSAILGGYGSSGDNIAESTSGDWLLPGAANYNTNTVGFQTAGFNVVAVPEPSSAVFLGVAGVLTILRRRRLSRSA